MKHFFLSFTAVLALFAALQAAEPPDQATAARVAVALALAQRQAPVTPQAPAVQEKCGNCNVVTGSGCTCDANCQCVPQWSGVGMPCPGADHRNPPPLNPLAAAPKYSFLIISRTSCPPCAKLKAELKAKGFMLEWDVYTNRPDLEFDYDVTAFPTILLLRDGKVIGRHIGYESAADLTDWRDDPNKPQSRGESVEKEIYDARHGTGGSVGNYGILRGTSNGNAFGSVGIYQPMMRYASPTACRA